MKQNIFKTGLLIFATLIFVSCNNEFLERYPLDELSNETYWRSENDLKVYNNSIYDMAKNDDKIVVLMAHAQAFQSTFASYLFWDEWSDNLAPRHSRSNLYKDVRAGIHIPQQNARAFGYTGWDFLREINVGLANYDRAKEKVAQDVIDQYAGEARMMRGWFYYDKVSKFGDVQYFDKELNIDSEELYGARTPRNEVMEKVLTDLNFAVDHLPTSWEDGQDPGRLDYWDALALKARVCLFEGTWQKYHGGSNASMWLEQASAAAKLLIENGPYSLYNTGDPSHDYNATHQKMDLTGNPEIIHWVKYEAGVRSNNVHDSYYQQYTGGATKNAVEDYLCTDGLPINQSPLYQGDDQLEDVFVNRDPRLRQTVLHPEDKEYYAFNDYDSKPYPQFEGMGGSAPTTTGYHLVKAWNVEASMAARNTSTYPGIVFRLGEVYLNYAEAKAELGTITQTDLDMTINLLRDRVGMPHLELNNVPVDDRYTGDGISPIIVEIRRERRVELFGEGFRYEDLRRWKQGKKLEIPAWGIQWNAAAEARFTGAKVQTSVDPVSGKTYVDCYKATDWATPVFNESKHYLWPIPLSAISENTNLTQTTGWE